MSKAVFYAAFTVLLSLGQLGRFSIATTGPEGMSSVNSTPPTPVNSTQNEDAARYLPWDVLFFCAFGLIFVLSVSGNALVMHVVRTTPSMHTSINLYIANMACSDIISTLVCVPFSLQSYQMDFKWIPGTEGRILCKTVYFIFYTSMACSTFNLAAIAVDRYLAVTKPLHRYSKRIVKIVISVIWAASVALSVPITLAYTNQVSLGNHSVVDVCYDADRDDLYLIGVMTMSIVCYVIPLTIASALYTLTGCRLHRRLRDNLGIKSVNYREKVRKSSLQASKMMATVIAVFALCWAPFFVYHVAKAWYVGYAGNILRWWYRPVCFLLASANPAINPCLYMAFNENFRRGFKEAVICKTKRRLFAGDKFASVPRSRARTLTLSMVSLQDMTARDERVSTL